MTRAAAAIRASYKLNTVYSISSMARVLGTIFAGLLGLAFGSFLNVCLSRWPAGESIISPRSHCRGCGRTLSWWENVPVVSWLALRGRCRSCGAWISWRYPLVELAVGALWAAVAWQSVGPPFDKLDLPSQEPPLSFIVAACTMLFCWILVALAVLDAEHLWLPNWLTLPGIAMGFLLTNFRADFDESRIQIGMGPFFVAIETALSILAAAGLILLIRWVYWLIRRREGIGLGDAKLMAMLAAWLGLQGALLSFAIGVVLGAMAALVVLVLPSLRKNHEGWAVTQLPLGTFLSVGGIVSSFWGQQMIDAYRRWAGF
jgi:leader peptidase (prepilin peptidase) / N-methyltransferase